ncbi:MAG: hypothetical protein WAV40_02070 [Microgenomates group bacterium]
METNQSPAQKETKSLLASELPFYLFAGTMLALCAIDFVSHPDFGVANIETRHHFIEILGPWIKYIGNYWISAAIGAGAGVTDHLARKQTGEISKFQFPWRTKWILAGGLTINPVIEGFPKNNELVGDTTVGTIGFLWGFFVAQSACTRIDSHLGGRRNPQQP